MNESGYHDTIPMKAENIKMYNNKCSFESVLSKERNVEEDSKKIELLEILVGGITHDFRNCLTSILGSISILKLSLENNTELNNLLLEAEKAAINARFLTQQLQNFSKEGIILEKELTSVNPLLEDSVKSLLRGTKIKSQFELNQDLWYVKVNQYQINQVINNIVINAMQALPNGGILKVSTKNKNLTPNTLIYPLEPGKHVQISIEDNGTGISIEHLSRIFDPYFTTKKEGSGLGLVTSYNIIKNYGGLITVNSQIGVGTTFHIYLPSSYDSTYQEKLVIEQCAEKR
jgi:signal transduction histidine kinase